MTKIIIKKKNARNVDRRNEIESKRCRGRGKKKRMMGRKDGRKEGRKGEKKRDGRTK